MVNILATSKVSTFPNEEYPNNLYTGYQIESVDINNIIRKGQIYDINESVSKGSFIINDHMCLDEESVVYKVVPTKNEYVNNIYLSFDLRNLLDDISIEETYIKNIKIGDYISNSFFYQGFLKNKNEIIRKGISESEWDFFVKENNIKNDLDEFYSPILVENINYEKKETKSFKLECVIQNEKNPFSTKLVKNVESIFIDSIMVKYKND